MCTKYLGSVSTYRVGNQQLGPITKRVRVLSNSMLTPMISITDTPLTAV